MNEKLNKIINLIKKNLLIEAETETKEYLKQKENLDIAYNLLGTIYIKQNKFEESIQLFNEALKINPDFISAIQNIGIAHQNLNNDAEAIKCFLNVIKLRPDLHTAYNNIGFIYNRQKNYKKAEENLNQSIKLNPNYAEAYLNLGIVLQKQKKYDESINNFKKAISINQNLFSAYFNLSEIYRSTENFKESLNYLLKSRHEKTNTRILECLLMLGMKDEYDKQVKKLSSKDPESRRISAISAYLSQQFNFPNINPFCPNPLEHIHLINLQKHFEKKDNFLSKLYEEMLNQEFAWESYARTTVNGSTTKGNLSEKNLPNLNFLEKVFEIEIKNYFNKFKESDCLFIKNSPKKYKFYSWSNRLKKQGHNIPHIHPSGWLSGVTYLKLPSNIKGNEAGIEFSLHGDDFKIINDKIPSKFFTPKIADLILFPSSLFHKTIPFSSNEERVCIAFDIIKVE